MIAFLLSAGHKLLCQKVYHLILSHPISLIAGERCGMTWSSFWRKTLQKLTFAPYMPRIETLNKCYGVMAIQCNSLQECNAKLKEFGPANFKKDRIKVKLRQGQETEISRGNLKIASMSGNSNSLPLHQRPKTCVWAGGTVPLWRKLVHHCATVCISCINMYLFSMNFHITQQDPQKEKSLTALRRWLKNPCP